MEYTPGQAVEQLGVLKVYIKLQVVAVFLIGSEMSSSREAEQSLSLRYILVLHVG